MPTGGGDQPAVEVVAEGSIAAGSAGERNRVVPDGNDTTSIFIQATKDGGNSGTVHVGFNDEVDKTSGVILSDGDTVSMEVNADELPVFAHFQTSGDEIRFWAVD